MERSELFGKIVGDFLEKDKMIITSGMQILNKIRIFLNVFFGMKLMSTPGP